MNTPIVDFVKKYTKEENLRLHMPGHKGKNFLGCEKWDITEIEGADVLYKANGIIKQSEENAASLFGTAKTLYSTEGSSLSIRAMLYLLKLYAAKNGEKPLIFAARNAHKTFVTAAALLDFDVFWLCPQKESSLISCDINADYIEECLNKSAQKPVAVYLTSPDYLGNILDIAKISKICKKYGILLLVDNAHGAYLNFLPENIHPINLGADMCCDSAHKTLPVLTGGAYLHISDSAPELFSQMAESAMALFASTSPSYLILQSLDMANKYLSENYCERLANFIGELEELKSKLADFGFLLFGKEPLKLTIAPKSYGYTGEELAKILSKKGIICEFSDPDFIVFMFTEGIKSEDLAKLETELLKIERRTKIEITPPALPTVKKRLSLNEAIMLPSKTVEIGKSVGKIAADSAITCPPAIPIVVCGEEITHESVKCFEYYKITTCAVIDKEI